MMMVRMMMIMIYLSMDVFNAICFHRKCFLPSRMTTRKMLRCTVIEPSMRSRSCPTHWSSSAISTASLAFWVRIRISMMIDCDDTDRIVMMMRRRRGVMIIMIWCHNNLTIIIWPVEQLVRPSSTRTMRMPLTVQSIYRTVSEGGMEWVSDLGTMLTSYGVLIINIMDCHSVYSITLVYYE